MSIEDARLRTITKLDEMERTLNDELLMTVVAQRNDFLYAFNIEPELGERALAILEKYGGVERHAEGIKFLRGHGWGNR